MSTMRGRSAPIRDPSDPATRRRMAFHRKRGLQNGSVKVFGIIREPCMPSHSFSCLAPRTSSLFRMLLPVFCQGGHAHRL